MKKLILTGTLILMIACPQVRADDCLGRYQAKIAQIQSELAQEEAIQSKFGKRHFYATEKWLGTLLGESAAGCGVGAAVTSWSGPGAALGCVSGAAIGAGGHAAWERSSAGKRQYRNWQDSDDGVDSEADAIGMRVNQLKEELLSTQNAYEMLREASIDKKPGSAIDETFNRAYQDFSDFEMTAAGVSLASSSKDDLDEARFTQLLARGDKAQLFCDSQGDVDGTANMVGKVMGIADREESQNWKPSVTNGDIEYVKQDWALDPDTAYSHDVGVYVPQASSTK